MDIDVFPKVGHHSMSKTMAEKEEVVVSSSFVQDWRWPATHVNRRGTMPRFRALACPCFLIMVRRVAQSDILDFCAGLTLEKLTGLCPRQRFNRPLLMYQNASMYNVL